MLVRMFRGWLHLSNDVCNAAKNEINILESIRVLYRQSVREKRLVTGGTVTTSETSLSELFDSTKTWAGV